MPSDNEVHLKVRTLSKRQRECLQGVVDLKSSKSIEQDLGISASTVDNYIAESIALLGVTDRRAAARVYLASLTAAPEKISGQKLPVEQDRPLPSSIPSAANDKPQPRDLSSLSRLRRLALVIGGALALALGLGLAALFIAGVIFFFDPSLRAN